MADKKHKKTKKNSWKEKQKNDGLEIIEDVKDPFSFANFFEEQVVERWKMIKKFLEDKGILYFFLSPFQYRSRLIVQIILVVVGITAGVVPRTMSLVDQAKTRNASSAIIAYTSTVRTSPTLTGVTFLGSSQYNKQHVIVARIAGTAEAGVPSSTARYNVELEASRGVVDAQSVSYSYEIVPMDLDTRLLVIYVDCREQNDDTGIYNLYIELEGEDIPNRYPQEISLGNAQETTDLFNENGVDLSVLTNQLIMDKQTPIKSGNEALEKALATYEITEETINNGGTGERVTVTTEKLREFIYANITIPEMTDSTTTSELNGLTIPTTITPVIQVDAGIVWNNTLFRSSSSSSSSLNESNGPLLRGDTNGVISNEVEVGEDVDADTQALLSAVSTNVSTLQSSLKSVIDAASSINTASNNRYNKLVAMRRVLNQKIDVSSFTTTKNIGGQQ